MQPDSGFYEICSNATLTFYYNEKECGKWFAENSRESTVSEVKAVFQAILRSLILELLAETRFRIPLVSLI